MTHEGPKTILKHKRIRAIIEALKSSELDKRELDLRVSAILCTDQERIRKALYRDLADLVSEGSLEEIRYFASGDIIDSYDPDVHKNTRCVWRLAEKSNDRYFGKQLAESFDIDTTGPRHLLMSIRYFPTAKQAKVGDYCFQLTTSSGSIFFDIDSSLRPFQIVIGRKHKSSEKDLTTLSASRKSGLEWREVGPTLNIRFEDSDGRVSREHLVIQINREGEVHVMDLKSSNGSKISSEAIDSEPRIVAKDGKFYRRRTGEVTNREPRKELQYLALEKLQKFSGGYEIRFAQARLRRIF